MSPCRLTTRSNRRSGSSAAAPRGCGRCRRAGRDRSAPPRRRPPAPLRRSPARRRRPQTGPTPASIARRQTCTIIGSPAIGASGLSGSRVEPSRAGIRTMVRDDMSSPSGVARDTIFTLAQRSGAPQARRLDASVRRWSTDRARECKSGPGGAPGGKRRGLASYGSVSRRQQAGRGHPDGRHHRRPAARCSRACSITRTSSRSRPSGSRLRRRGRRRGRDRRPRRSRSACCWRRPTPRAARRSAKKCAACHSFDKGGANKVGPNLWGVVSRPIAAHEGFSYSAALAEKKGQPWTYDDLNHFLASPKAYAPGTKMSFAGISKDTERANLLAYLRTLADEPGTAAGRLSAGARGDRALYGEFVALAHRLADCAGEVAAPLFPHAGRGRYQGRREPGDHRRPRGRGGDARADRGGLPGARHPGRGVRRRAHRRRVRLGARPDRRHQVVHHRPAAVRHADRAARRRPAGARHHRPVDPAASAGSASPAQPSIHNGRPIRVRPCPELAEAVLFATSPRHVRRRR